MESGVRRRARVGKDVLPIEQCRMPMWGILHYEHMGYAKESR